MSLDIFKKYGLTDMYVSPPIDLIHNTELNTGGNGDGRSRLDECDRKGLKVCTMKVNREFRFSEHVSDSEESKFRETITQHIETKKLTTNKPKNSLWFIMFGGKVVVDKTTRSIRKDIRNFYRKQPCVNCGTTCNLEVDHKNGLYNDKRVLNTKTQTIDDFQSLCRHCNLVKRQALKKAVKTGIRPSALDIPKNKAYGVSYTTGDETFNVNDINAMLGTYWYDPIAFGFQLRNLHK